MPTPVYETTKEGPSHAPSFKSTVIVNEVRYDSLPGFSNRKIAEQSAAEVALVELAKSADVDRSISQPIVSCLSLTELQVQAKYAISSESSDLFIALQIPLFCSLFSLPSSTRLHRCQYVHI